MSAKLKKEDVLGNADIVAVIGQYVSLKKKGREIVGLCPFHAEKNPSFTVSPKGFYKCFGCGEGGDLPDFIMKMERVDFPGALKLISEKSHSGGMPLISELSKNIPPKPIDPPIDPPDGTPPPMFVHSRWGNPTSVHPYTNVYGKTIGYTVRFDPPNEKKQVLPLSYRKSGTWQWLMFAEPRPIYNLDSLKRNAGKTVLIVEGEKVVDYVQMMLTNTIVISWSGGVDAVEKTDWSVLAGCENVCLCPDNDYTHTFGKSHKRAGEVMPFHLQPGNRAMLKIAEILKPIVGKLHWINPLEGTPCGWDLADKQWTAIELRNFVASHRTTIPVIEEEKPVQPIELNQSDMPFTPLGFKKEGDSPKYCFFSGLSTTVISMSASAMSKQNLLNLAPLNWWETYYHAPRGSRNSFNVDAASEFLMNACLSRGIFSEERIRGRGAWVDKNRSVFHSGDSLIVDGVVTPLKGFDSRYVYELGVPLEFSTEHPIETHISEKLISLCQMISWSRSINAYLLAGWCVIAPICGALPWRPHIWITGPSGTGKSWILKEIIRRLLGETAIAVQADTTAPGLRAYLNNDALPVVFDEAEGEHQSAQDRIRSAIELMRAASSEGSGGIAKGSAGGGKASITKMRSMFCFSSIVPQPTMQADKRRTTFLELRKDLSPEIRRENFKRLCEFHLSLINDEFVQGLHARTMKLLPVILHNSEVFNQAVASVLGEKAYGDQIGPMLAGAYSLCSEHQVDFETAKAFIPGHDWSEESSLEGSRDEIRLFSHIMEQIVEVEGEYQKFKRTIGELCQISRGLNDPNQNPYALPEINAERADMTLRRHGIKIEHSMIVISNQHDGIKRLLARTPWGAGNHGKLLIRIEGSQKITSTTFSRGGIKSNAVAVPVAMLD